MPIACVVPKQDVSLHVHKRSASLIVVDTAVLDTISATKTRQPSVPDLRELKRDPLLTAGVQE